MVDTARRARWPQDMREASTEPGQLGGVEAMAGDLLESLRGYVRSNPEQAALWALGLGFVLGWKLKPW